MVIEEKKKEVKKKTRRKTKADIEREKKLEEDKKAKEEAQKEVVEMIMKLFSWLKEDAEEEERKFWRPRKIRASEVYKLKACFSVGMTVTETLYFSWIKKGVFYKYLKENPDFMNEIEYIKKATTLKAKFNIQNAINKWSIYDSWKWLEKKEPQEFWNKLWVGNIDMTPFENITIEIVKNENKDN